MITWDAMMHDHENSIRGTRSLRAKERIPPAKQIELFDAAKGEAGEEDAAAVLGGFGLPGAVKGEVQFA